MKKLFTISAIILALICWSSILIFSMDMRPIPRPAKTDLATMKTRKLTTPFEIYPSYFNLLTQPFKYGGNTMVTSKIWGNYYEVNSNYIIKNSNTTIILPKTYYIQLIPHYTVQQGPK